MINKKPGLNYFSLPHRILIWILVTGGYFIPLVNLHAQATNKIDTIGSVGIGTVSPATPLHVRGGAVMTDGWNKTATLEATFPVQIYNSNASKWAGIGYDYTTGLKVWVNASSNDLPATGNAAFSVFNNGNVGIGTAAASFNSGGGLHIYNTVPATIRLQRASGSIFEAFATTSESWISTVNNTSLVFATNNTPAVTISNDQNIGIGTSSPGFNSGSGIHIYKNVPATLRLERASGSVFEAFANTADSYLGTVNNSSMKLTTHNTVALTIDTLQNIGIGTNLPSERLSVNGNISAKKTDHHANRLE